MGDNGDSWPLFQAVNYVSSTAPTYHSTTRPNRHFTQHQPDNDVLCVIHHMLFVMRYPVDRVRARDVGFASLSASARLNE